MLNQLFYYKIGNCLCQVFTAELLRVDLCSRLPGLTAGYWLEEAGG